MTTRADIDSFLSLKRIAFVGVSRSARDFTRAVFTEFLRRGYDALPVNPNASEIGGLRSYRQVSEIAPPPEGVLILTAPAMTLDVVRDCAAAGIRHVWMHRGAGQGSVSPEAVEFCRAQGIQVVAGECPFMFLQRSGWVHGLHRFFRRVTGALPA